MKTSIKIALGGVALTAGAVGVGIAIGRKNPSNIRTTSASQSVGVVSSANLKTGKADKQPGSKSSKPPEGCPTTPGEAADVAAYADGKS